MAKTLPKHTPAPRLTRAEATCFDAIVHLTAKLGRPPSILEVAERLGVSKSGAQQHMDALRLKGALLGPRVVGDWEVTPLGKKMRKAID